MAGARGAAARILNEADAAFDWLRYQVRRSRGGHYRVVPYAAHGTPERLHLVGRVLEGEPIPRASESDTAWRNLLHTLRRLETDEIPAARVRASAGGAVQEVVADEEGYFRVTLEVSGPPAPGPLWRPIELQLLDPVPAPGEGRAVGLALVPSPDARFGVISDIDDTVVKTDATRVLSMFRLVFLTNARTRLPFDGVTRFYRALAGGAGDAAPNPVFYVSSSPWSFHDLLREVFEVHGIPAGPLFLRDYGLSREVLFAPSHTQHKLEAIERILTIHPDLAFVLLGDSGQDDATIYREVVRRFPGRVRAVYIRDVSRGGRDREVGALAEELRADGVDLVLSADTHGFAAHAAAHGLIAPADLDWVRAAPAGE
jgi:phosphatidate phosphatase APP1